MKIKGLIAAASLAAFAAVPASAASLYNLTATSNDSDVSHFFLTFEDLDTDMLFSLNELQSFSGITVFSTFYSTLEIVPDLPNFTDGGTTGFDCLGAFTDDWCFGRTDSSGNLTDEFFRSSFFHDYHITPVPLPAGLPLLLTGLAGFVGLRMREKRAARV